MALKSSSINALGGGKSRSGGCRHTGQGAQDARLVAETTEQRDLVHPVALGDGARGGADVASLPEQLGSCGEDLFWVSTRAIRLVLCKQVLAYITPTS